MNRNYTPLLGGCYMVHDAMLTENYFVMIVPPTRYDLGALMTGKGGSAPIFARWVRAKCLASKKKTCRDLPISSRHKNSFLSKQFQHVIEPLFFNFTPLVDKYNRLKICSIQKHFIQLN